MKILFVTIAYPKGSESYLQNLNKGIPLGIPSNTFQWAVIEGLYKNNADFEVVSQPSLCCYPFHFKKLFSPQLDMVYEGKRVGTMLKTFRLTQFANLAGRIQLKSVLRKWANNNRNEDKLVVLVYSTQSDTLKAITSIKKEFRNLIICPIVTDLVDELLNPIYKRSLRFRISSKREIKSVKKLYPLMDKFILLSKSMEEKIPEAKGKSIVIEGIALNPSLHFQSKKETETRSVLYTGSLAVHTSITDLVDAFMLTNNNKYRLIICGTGSGAEYIVQASRKDPRIIFKGFVSRDEAVKLQQEATVVINPRKPTISLTRYSFPSKTMEYMSSGTPMIGYRLKGIPEEYYNYYYTVDGLSNEDMAQCICTVLDKSQEELNEKAKAAMNFIANNKTATIQVKKIISFLSA